MRQSPRRPSIVRSSRLEAMEPRMLLSAVPVGDILLDHVVDNSPANQVCVSSIDAYGATVGYELTGLDDVWNDYGLTGAGQTVAVIDTGIAYDHVDLGGGFGDGFQVVGGFDFTGERDADPYDDGPAGGHGTHVAGVIAGETYGVAPGVDLVGLRVFDDSGYGELQWVEEALQWVHDNRFALDNPITTVNLSIGIPYDSEMLSEWITLEDELAQLEDDGIFIAVAAGNGFTSLGETGLSYPAASEHVVPVGSVDGNGSLSYFSQRDTQMIAAPGRSILSTVPDYAGNQNGVTDDFARYSGTSMAGPYVAGAAALLREAYQIAGRADVTQDDLYGVMFDTADVVHDTVTGLDYRRLNLDRAVDSILPEGIPVDTPTTPGDDSGPQIAPIDLGTVLQGRFDGYAVSSDGQWFTITAAADGLLSVETLFDHGRGDVDLQLFDADGQLLGTSEGMGNIEQINVTSKAGETFRLRAYVYGGGATDGVDLRITNLVRQSGKTLVVSGTDGDDQIDFSAGSSYRVTVNDVAYEFAAGSINSIRIDAGGGNDTVVLDGTSGNERAVLRVNSAEMTGPGYRVVTTNTEFARLRGGGGTDRAVFYDSAGNDEFLATPASARLVGRWFDNRAQGFEQIEAYATAGGIDVAKLVDSTGNDQFVATPTYAAMQGAGFLREVRFFDAVHAYATAGGFDTAKLFDSVGNDTFHADPIAGALFGDGFYNRAKYFENVHAYATSGGNDTAWLYDSAGNDMYVGSAIADALFGQGFFNRAKHFETVRVHAEAGGTDQAILYDAALGGNRRVDAAKAVWLYDFEECFTAHSTDDEKVERAIDEILMGYWT